MLGEPQDFSNFFTEASILKSIPDQNVLNVCMYLKGTTGNLFVYSVRIPLYIHARPEGSGMNFGGGGWGGLCFFVLSPFLCLPTLVSLETLTAKCGGC